jgi:hypothetical protein
VPAHLFSILYNKRFSVFHFPVSEEEVPDYRSVVHTPMDMATILWKVDSGQYLTRAAFMKDIDLIVSNAKVHVLLWGKSLVFRPMLHIFLPYIFKHIAIQCCIYDG